MPGERPEQVAGTRSATSGTTSGWVQFAIAALIAFTAELTLRLLYDPASHLFGQRQSEVYGWLSMLGLLLVLASRRLRLRPYRRALGLSAFGYAVIHVWYAYEHILNSEWENAWFLSPADQAATWIGVTALLGLIPMALTSSSWAVRRLGRHWKTLHMLGPPMTLLAAVHTAWIGVHFGLSPLAVTSAVLLFITLALLLLRHRKGTVK